MTLRQEIRQFVVDTFLFGEDSALRDDSSFLGEGIVDSTGILQLVSFLQEQYLITIEDEELVPDNLDSISRVAAFVQAKQQALVPQPA